MSFLAIPGLGAACGMATMACSLVTNTCVVCCTVASCFTCKPSYGASKLLYVGIFMLSAVLGIVLRYEGEAALSSWAKTLNVCTNAQCWGQQADYRISGALFAFFITMAALSALYRPAHLGAWFVKLLYYLLLLGVTLAIPNDFWVGYSQFSRYGSIFFIIAQVFIIIDFAYTAHEWLLAKIDASDAELEAKGWEPGLCSSPWKALYMLSAFLLVGGSITGIGLMYHYFGACALNQFFLSETLVLGTILVMVSMMNAVGKGLLPPSMLFAYNTFLVYGAITNNPDASCNLFAASENQNQASIIAGCIISVLSVTWAAYSSAGSAGTSLVMQSRKSVPTGSGFPPPGAQGASNPIGDVEASGGAPAGVKDWRPPSTGAAGTGSAKAGTAEAYQLTSGGASAAAAGAPKDSSGSAALDAAYAEDEKPTAADARPWLFHIIMALGGLYLGMAITNWGSAEATTPGANPELSVASMWVRIVSQWLVWGLYAWTLVAPICCPNRDFS